MKNSGEISNSKVISSFLWVLIEKFGYSGISLFSTLALARLLSPYEFGLVGAVTIIVSMSNMIVESGMGAALVNKKKVTKRDFDTVFTFNLIMSFSLYIIIFLSAPFIASYFGDSILKNVVRFLSLTLIFNTFTLVQRTILIRKLLFKKQSFISLTSLAISVTIAIFGAYRGWGVWAIVSQLVIYSAVYSFIISLIIQYPPRLYFSFTLFKDLLGFGGRITLSSAIQVGYHDIISSVIAKIYTFQVTGLYDQSQKLIAFPTNIFRSLFDSAAFPILSKIKDRLEFKKMCSQINRGIYFLAFPLLLVIPFNAREIIEVVLGERWVGASEILAILGIGIVILLINISSLSILKSSGEVRKYLSVGTSKTIVGLSVLSVTLPFPIEIMLYGIIFTNLITGIIAIYYVDNLTFYTVKEQLKDIVIPLSIAFISNAIAFIGTQLIDFSKGIVGLSIHIVVMSLGFIGLCLLLKIRELNFLVKKLKIR